MYWLVICVSKTDQSFGTINQSVKITSFRDKDIVRLLDRVVKYLIGWVFRKQIKPYKHWRLLQDCLDFEINEKTILPYEKYKTHYVTKLKAFSIHFVNNCFVNKLQRKTVSEETDPLSLFDAKFIVRSIDSEFFHWWDPEIFQNIFLALKYWWVWTAYVLFKANWSQRLLRMLKVPGFQVWPLN